MSNANGRKSIFITGAASGIGAATAELFAKEGWYIGGFDVNQTGLEALAAKIGQDNCLVGQLDVTDRQDYQKALDGFGAATDGRMDILFNNAGIGRGGLFADMEMSDILDVVNVNFIGVLNGIHLALPLLRSTQNALCFTTSSSSATYGMPGIAVYSATKKAVKGLTEALAVEFALYGIRAADTLPGLIDTPILPDEARENAATEGMFRLTQPLEVAKAVWQAYHEDKIHWYVPPEISDLDQASIAAPELVREQMKTEGPIAALFDELKNAELKK